MSVKIANKTLSSTFVKVSTKASKAPKVEVFVFGSEVKEKERTEVAKSNLLAWQFSEWSKTKPSSFAGAGEKSAVLLVSAPKVSKEILERDAGLLSPSEYSSLRNALGSSLRKYLIAGEEASINLHFHALNDAETLGSLVGIDLAAYSYKFSQTKINWFLGNVSKKLLDEAKNIAMGVNISRHLVNMPANELYPDSYAKVVKKLFPNKEGLKVDVWSYAKLKKKNGLTLSCWGRFRQ